MGAGGSTLEAVRTGTLELHLTSLEQSLLHPLAANAGRVVVAAKNVMAGVDCGFGTCADVGFVDSKIV